MSFLKKHSLAAGFVLMFVLSWPIDLAAAAASRGRLPFNFPEPLALFVGFGFVAAALIATGLTLGKSGVRDLLKRFLIWRVNIFWYAVVLAGNAAVYLLAIAIYAIWTGNASNFNHVAAKKIADPSIPLVFFAPAFFLFNVIMNGEEIGWRGYALPRLQARYSALVSSLILGLVWAVWHFPKYLIAGNTDSFALRFVFDPVHAILFTWVFNSTRGSLLLATLFHAAGNTAYVCLPVAPSAVGTAGPFFIATALEVICASAVVFATGPARLSRAENIPVQAR